MFYYLMAPIITYNWILILSAVVPAIFLMVKVYKADRLEKESPGILFSMVIGGILATLIAIVIERVGQLILDNALPKDNPSYNIILYFIIVGFAEELSKYIMLKRRSWHSTEFNCQYDGVVYAVFTSLGFALWENISYVLHYGFSTEDMLTLDRSINQKYSEFLRLLFQLLFMVLMIILHQQKYKAAA